MEPASNSRDVTNGPDHTQYDVNIHSELQPQTEISCSFELQNSGQVPTLQNHSLQGNELMDNSDARFDGKPKGEGINSEEITVNHKTKNEKSEEFVSDVMAEAEFTSLEVVQQNESGYDSHAVEKQDIQNEALSEDAVEFKKGTVNVCTDVPSALEVLRTRYKLADVSYRREPVSWSSWNIADMVRGPHRESYYWRGRGVDRKFNQPSVKQINGDEKLNGEMEIRADVQSQLQTPDYEMEEICSKIESKDKEIALMLKKILDQDEERSKDLELLTVKTEPSNTLNRRNMIELNSEEPKRRENAFHRLMRAIRKRFSSRGRTPNKSPKGSDKHLNTLDTPKREKGSDRLSLGGSFRQKFRVLRRSNSERVQKSSRKSQESLNKKSEEKLSPNKKKEKKEPVVSPEPAAVKPEAQDDERVNDSVAATVQAANILISLESEGCKDITIEVPQGPHYSPAIEKNSDHQNVEPNVEEKISAEKDAGVQKEYETEQKSNDVDAGIELLLKADLSNLESCPPDQIQDKIDVSIEQNNEIQPASAAVECQSQPNEVTPLIEEELITPQESSQLTATNFELPTMEVQQTEASKEQDQNVSSERQPLSEDEMGIIEGQLINFESEPQEEQQTHFETHTDISGIEHQGELINVVSESQENQQSHFETAPDNSGIIEPEDLNPGNQGQASDDTELLKFDTSSPQNFDSFNTSGEDLENSTVTVPDIVDEIDNGTTESSTTFENESFNSPDNNVDTSDGYVQDNSGGSLSTEETPTDDRGIVPSFSDQNSTLSQEVEFSGELLSNNNEIEEESSNKTPHMTL